MSKQSRKSAGRPAEVKQAVSKKELLRLDWLVSGRSANQAVQLELYNILEQYSGHFVKEHNDFNTAQMMLGVAFSLWRAVFLNKVSNTRQAVYEDATSFLKNLIENNAVAYTQDQAAKNWTFRFYLQCARDRLERIARTPDMNLLPDDPPNWHSLNTPKKAWWAPQRMLEKAVKNFRSALEEKTQDISS